MQHMAPGYTVSRKKKKTRDGTRLLRRLLPLLLPLRLLPACCCRCCCVMGKCCRFCLSANLFLGRFAGNQQVRRCSVCGIQMCPPPLYFFCQLAATQQVSCCCVTLPTTGDRDADASGVHKRGEGRQCLPTQFGGMRTAIY